MLSAKELKRPPVLTPAEIADKLIHLRGILGEIKAGGILFIAEGALRWLTGVRHEIIAQEPGANSPVKALVTVSGKGVEITLIAPAIELPRLRDEVPPLFKGAKGVNLKFVETLPTKLPAGTLLPGAKNYPETVGKIVRPLIGGISGNQFKKYSWVAAMTAKVVAESAYQVHIGMNGAEVRALLLKNLAENGVETNMILLALKGQNSHLHPLYGEQYHVATNCYMKLVTAGRFGEVIVSETQMVKFGKLSEKETAAYRALQDATLEYADLYRAGANERNIYRECGERFNRIEKQSGLKGFGKSAYLHHLGGPTSPLGNRDYTLTPESRNIVFPGMAFAINPVENIFGSKVELQGVVTEHGTPVMLDPSTMVDKRKLAFREVSASGGTKAQVQEFIILGR